MRATPLAVTALAAALLLTACDSGGDSAKETGKEKSTACTLGEVSLEIGPANAAPAAGDTGNVSVTVTNSSAQCTLDGFPGVGLHAGDSSAAVPVDKAAPSQKLTLAKGSTTSFTITYVRGAEGGKSSVAAKTMKVSLPGDDADTQEFPWTYGAVALKSGDEPDATVSGFTQSGD
ncbi:DUF4232 domain-containing protein [Streptomyces sp. DG2A-72]|uniref:DUF4232 domain-containing protein n=1 Tax=Streptomyces sp. DG2A-72 TaxID=3051386 RepID=UPI00265B8F4A|nr:DUF4232 domain-containing protein [Streptomyces sp. DG2A-72]MDO0935266.1 DUF4232 domain-containing protein [Streptomyces sp. DG2A-72]